jgi:hypothetical protein
VTADNIVKTFDGQTSTPTGVWFSTTPNASLQGTVIYDGAVNVGAYAPSGLYSDQQGYFISYFGGNLKINSRPLRVTADPKFKAYGEVNPALTYSVAADGVGTSRGLVNGDTLSGSLTTAATSSSGAGSYSIDASALSNGNYLVTANNGTLEITPAPAPAPAPTPAPTPTDKGATTTAVLMPDEKRKTQVLQMTGADMNVRIVGPGVKLPCATPVRQAHAA